MNICKILENEQVITVICVFLSSIMTFLIEFYFRKSERKEKKKCDEEERREILIKHTKWLYNDLTAIKNYVEKSRDSKNITYNPHWLEIVSNCMPVLKEEDILYLYEFYGQVANFQKMQDNHKMGHEDCLNNSHLRSSICSNEYGEIIKHLKDYIYDSNV